MALDTLGLVPNPRLGGPLAVLPWRGTVLMQLQAGNGAKAKVVLDLEGEWKVESVRWEGRDLPFRYGPGRLEFSMQGFKPGRKPFYQTTIGRITEGVYAFLPHTEDLDNLVDRQLMRDFAVAGPFRALMESASFSWEKGLGLTLLHTVAYLGIACTIFSRRDP